MYVIQAAQINLKSPAQILECCQYITLTLTTYLAEVFQIQPPRPMYNYCPQDLSNDMIRQSHKATATGLQLAEEGKLLEKLNSTQSSDIETINFTGTPAKRAPHNGGKRRVRGTIKKNNYSLVEQEFTTEDPYSTKVNFPSTAQERHCGRKRTRTAPRGVSMTKLKDHAINSLSTQLDNISSNDANLEPKKSG